MAVFDNATVGQADNNTYDCQITIYRAGTFELEVMINGIHIDQSPMLDWLLVKPAEIYAPTCIVQDHVLEMIAGDTYTAQIQSRDFYSNNRQGLLAESVMAWEARIVEIDPTGASNATIMCNGTITDNAGNPGVFDYTFTPLQTGTNYKIELTINGMHVDLLGEYRSTPLVVTPAIITDVLTTNYSILADTDQSYVQYTDQEETRHYEYITGDSVFVLIDCRDAYSNVRYGSDSELLLVTLTG